jgi:hypothetical protein
LAGKTFRRAAATRTDFGFDEKKGWKKLKVGQRDAVI